MTASLRVRNFWLFALGQVASVTGTWMMFTAQDWLVLRMTGASASALGVVTAAQFTPVLLMTSAGGAMADRLDRRRLLMAANSVSALLALALGLTGCAMVAFAQSSNHRVQLGSDPAHRGRFMVLYTLVFQGTTPFGALLMGWLADRWGVRGALMTSGSVCLSAVLVAWGVSLARHGRERSVAPTRVASGRR